MGITPPPKFFILSPDLIVSIFVLARSGLFFSPGKKEKP